MLMTPKNAVTASNMVRSRCPAAGPNGMRRYTVKRISSADQESDLTDDLEQHRPGFRRAAGSFGAQIQVAYPGQLSRLGTWSSRRAGGRDRNLGSLDWVLSQTLPLIAAVNLKSSVLLQRNRLLLSPNSRVTLIWNRNDF
jgi:hypothetical protein